MAPGLRCLHCGYKDEVDKFDYYEAQDDYLCPKCGSNNLQDTSEDWKRRGAEEQKKGA